MVFLGSLPNAWGVQLDLSTLAGQIPLASRTLTSRMFVWLSMPGAVFCQAAQSLTLYRHSSVSSQRCKGTPISFLVLLLSALSRTPVICSTNPSCPSCLKLQSLLPLSRKTSVLSLDSTLYAKVWKVPTAKKLEWISSSPHMFSFLKDHRQLALRILETWKPEKTMKSSCNPDSLISLHLWLSWGHFPGVGDVGEE